MALDLSLVVLGVTLLVVGMGRKIHVFPLIGGFLFGYFGTDLIIRLVAK